VDGGGKGTAGKTRAALLKEEKTLLFLKKKKQKDFYSPVAPNFPPWPGPFRERQK
jgi:hypothetical protein